MKPVVNTSFGIYVRGCACLQRDHTNSLQLPLCFSVGYSALMFSHSKQIYSRIQEGTLLRIH